MSVAAVERASGLAQEVRGRTEDARGRERTRVLSGVALGGQASRCGGESQAVDVGGQKRRQAAAEAVVEVSGG